MNADEIGQTLKRMSAAVDLLSIRHSDYGFEPEITKAYASDLVAASLAQDAVQLLAHFRDGVPT